MKRCQACGHVIKRGYGSEQKCPKCGRSLRGYQLDTPGQSKFITPNPADTQYGNMTSTGYRAFPKRNPDDV